MEKFSHTLLNMPDNPKPSENSTEQKRSPEDWLELGKKKVEELLQSWGASGALLFLAGHFWRNGKLGEATIALVGAGVIAVLIKFYAQLDPKLNKLFEWVADNLEHWVLSAWWRVTANFQGKYYEQLVYNCRDFRTQGLKTRGAFTLDLDKVFVPLQVAPESADRISSDMMREKASQHCLEIWDFFAELAKHPNYKRIVVIGPPGSGKTTLLEHLTLMYAQNTQRRQHRKAPSLIPVLLYLRTVRGKISSDNPPSLAELIEQQQDIAALNPKGWFAEKLKQGKCLVMLDGLDEVADEDQRRKVSQWIDQQMKVYSRNVFLLTSRPFGYRTASLEQIGTILEMQQFSLKQTRQFIQNWYLQNEIKSRLGKVDAGVRQVAKSQSDDLMYRIQNQPTLATMALNPLLLTMIATVHRFRGALPGRRVELYGEICDVLLGRRQDAKGIPDPLTAPQKQSILQGLALALMQQPTREFTLERGSELIREKLRMMVGEAMQPVNFLREIANQTGLLIERERGVYEFAHKSFQEYLAAVEVKDTNQEVLLTQKVGEDWWFETIRLYAAQSDASPLIRAALEQSTVPALTLAVDCLDEGLKVTPDVRETLKQCLERGLESTNAELFKLAAEVKLAGRLNRLLRIDNSIEIDTTLITCAEYQLFIDASRKKKLNRQPDHWTAYRFTPGDAEKPIAGVRASDAEEFCQWLSEQRGERYRLPQASEVGEHPIADRRVGFWFISLESKRIDGISKEQHQTWTHTMVEKFKRDLERDRTHDRARTCALDLDRDYALDLASALDHALDLASALDLDFTLERALERDHALERDRALERALERNHDLERDHALDRARDFALNLDLALALDHTRDRALERTLDLKFDNEIRGLTRSYLLLAAVFWSLLSQASERARQRQHFLRHKVLSRQECEAYSLEYANNRDTILRAYCFFVLLELRAAGQMPAWEGIRIVRERPSQS